MELPEQSHTVTETPMIRISSFSKYVLLIVAILILANISIEFDIPIYRQVMGILLLLLPGLLFVRLLNPIIKDTTEKLLITFGTCISTLIFIGLILCYISRSIGVDRPLSTEPLLIMLDSICILFIGLLTRRNYSVIEIGIPKNRLTAYDKFFLSIIILIPLWSFFGVHMMNKYSDNTYLLGLFIFVSIYFIFLVNYHAKIRSNIYPLIILLISISFVLLYPMRSNHLLGIDIHIEYGAFKQVMNNLNWQLTNENLQRFSILWPCISISLLPALLQSILKVDPDTLYRYYIPLLFSVTPIIVYVIAKHYFNDNEAFLASIVFISYNSFFTASAYSRATLALLFFALIIMVLSNDTLHQYQKSIMLLLFSTSMILTHYSSTFVFLFIFGTSSIISQIFIKKAKLNKKITSLTLVLTIFACTFLWYGMITDIIFKISLNFLKLVLDIDNIYIEGSHSEQVYQLTGNVSNNYISKLNLINTWIFLFLIGLGIICLLLRTKDDWFESKGKDKQVILLKKEFEPEFVIIALLCIITLVMTLILPFLSNGYDLNRIYFEISPIISIVFILGGKYASIGIMKIINLLKISNMSKNNHMETYKLGYIIILIVLIPHFLFVTNTPQQLGGIGDTITLNSGGYSYDSIFIHDYDISCIKWWDYNKMKNYNIWADQSGKMQIADQGNGENYLKPTENSEKIHEAEYIYLRETNIERNKIYISNITETTKSFGFNDYPLSKIYSSPSTILFKTG